MHNVMYKHCTAVRGAQFQSAVDGIYNYSYLETAPDQGVDPPAGDILQAECTDSSGDPIEATYTITSGNSDPFQINTTTGQLSWRQGQVLDYETVTFYLFSIKCVDNSNTDNTATAMVNVSVLPVNEFVPMITPAAISLTITDGSPVGTVLVSTEPGAREQYTVHDLDDDPDGQITFTRSNQSNPDFLRLFQLNPRTGALSIAQSLVGTTLTSGRIIICDTNPPRDECPNLSVTIIVTRVVAKYDPSFNRSRVHIDLPESAESGTLVVTTMCSDQDNGLGAYQGIDIYSITPISLRNSFRLNSTEDGYGIVSLQQPLDYEMLQPQEIINITLRCFDNQPIPMASEDFVEIIINVLPVNDNAPQFGQIEYSFSVDVAKNVDRVCCVSATDADRDAESKVRLTLQGAPRMFTIQNSGEITFQRSNLSDKVGTTFMFTAVASDGQFNTSVPVSLTITETSSTLGTTEIIIIVVVCCGALILCLFVALFCCCCVFFCCR